MKSWERERAIIVEEMPAYNMDDNEVFWEEQSNGPEQAQDIATKVYWHSQVPGSRAKESIANAAIQATENKGYIVEGGEELLEKGYAAYDNEDYVSMHKYLYDVFRACDNAKKDETSPYWNQKFYDSFEEYAAVTKFPETVEVDMGKALDDKQHAGWLAQIIGGAYGTCIEGYTGANIAKKYGGKVDRYVRKPNTYNDDITYELALLLAYEEFGKETTAFEIGREWIARIPTGWSAEDFALRNLKAGIMPPESGRFHNAFNEWIGAQMRGVICGQIYPGNVYKAAEAAWMDGSISHNRNGILGEVFNAIMQSMAYYETDVRKIVEAAVEMMPADSEYGQVVRFALEQCKTHDDFYSAWYPCEIKYQRYNWIHVYPNAAAEVIGLWFGNGDFTETLACCGGCGQDVDCNAAQVATIVGTIIGYDGIPEYWKNPIGDELITYVRGLKKMSIRALGERTADVARKLK